MLRCFHTDENGAVTVDFLVLSAAAIAVALVLLPMLGEALGWGQIIADQVDERMASIPRL